MNDFLQQIYFGNSLKLYCTVLLTIILAIIFKRYLSKSLATLLYNFVSRAGKNLNKKDFLELVVNPLEIFIVIFIAYVALDKLNYPTIFDFHLFKYSSKQIFDCLANGSLVIAFIWLCLRLIDFVALILIEKANHTKDATDNQLIVFFKDFFKVIIVIVGVLLIIKFSFNKNISNLLTSLSIVGAAMALATRESLENLIASFVIFFDKPFTVGDIVKVHTYTGTVEKIGLRSTRLRTENKTYVSVPNKQMVDSIIDNISLRTERKGELKLEISVFTTAESLIKIQDKLRLYIEANKSIINHSIYITETGKNAHILFVEYYTDITPSIEAFLEIRQNINLKAISILQEENVLLAATHFAANHV